MCTNHTPAGTRNVQKVYAGSNNKYQRPGELPRPWSAWKTHRKTYSSQRMDNEASASVIGQGVRQLQGKEQISAESYLDYTRLHDKIWQKENGTEEMAVVNERCCYRQVAGCELIVSILVK